MNYITVIDAVCGAGKTSYAIQYMNKYGIGFGDNIKSFIYVTPYLTEIERIKKSCPNLKFLDPINKGEGKLDSLKKLIVNRDNIHHSQTCRKQGDGNIPNVSSFRANQRERGNLLQLQRDEIATRLKALAMT